jgi:hypothetical protein
VQKVPIKPLFNNAELTNRELEVLKLILRGEHRKSNLKTRFP